MRNSKKSKDKADKAAFLVKNKFINVENDIVFVNDAYSRLCNDNCCYIIDIFIIDCNLREHKLSFSEFMLSSTFAKNIIET